MPFQSDSTKCFSRPEWQHSHEQCARLISHNTKLFARREEWPFANSNSSSSCRSSAWTATLRRVPSARTLAPLNVAALCHDGNDSVAQAWTTAQATTIKKTLLSTPEIFDNSCLSMHEPLDPFSTTHDAFQRKSDEIHQELLECQRKTERIRHELREFCMPGLGQLLQFPVKEQESKSCCIHEQQSQMKGCHNKYSPVALELASMGIDKPTILWHGFVKTKLSCHVHPCV